MPEIARQLPHFCRDHRDKKNSNARWLRGTMMALGIRSAALAALTVASFGGPAMAGSCPGQMFVAKNETAPPTSVNAADIAAFVAAAPWAEGVRVTAEERGAELWLDVTEFPGNTTAAAAPRTAWLVGRIMDTDVATVVFSDADQALFQIEARALKDIGCRFVVGEEAGENPIALMREFYDARVL